MKKKLIVLLLSAISINSYAVDKTKEIPEEIVFDQVNEIFQGKSKIENIKKSELDNAYYVTVDNNPIIFFTNNSYFITGDLYNGKNKYNLTASYQAENNKKILEQIPDKDTITYNTHVENKLGTLYVFTDPSCPYCEKLHTEIDEYLKTGVDVKYLPYPRFGEKGPGYKSTLQSWCAEDQKATLDLAMKNDKENLSKINVDTQKCVDLMSKYQDIGKKLGVVGTPAVFMDTGHQIGGYNPANTIPKFYQIYKIK